MDWLRVLLICVPIIVVVLTIIVPLAKGVGFENTKWIGTIFFLFALLAFSVDRLELIKMFGLEAKLSKLDKATQEAYATIQEVEKSRQEIRSLGETLVLQQVQTIMKANRLVSEDFISERAKSIQILLDTLKRIDASPEAIKEANDVVTNYIRMDLKNYAFRRVHEALKQSESEKAKALLRDGKFNREQFFEDFISGEIGKTLERVSLYLNKSGVEVTDDVRQSLNRLDSFLQDSVLLDSSGNKVLTVQKFQGSQ